MRSRSGIALVIADMHGGGAQQVVSQLASAWSAEGKRVAIITFSPAEGDFFALDEPVERISLRGGCDAAVPAPGRLLGFCRRIMALRGALRTFGGETAIGFIVHTNILLVAASRGLGYRVIISERNDPARQSFGRVWDTLRRLFYARADLVAANSRGALESLASYVPREKLAYVPNILRPAPEAVTDERSRSEPVRERLILNVARLHSQKAQDHLVRAFAAALPRLAGWRLAIIGEGGERGRLEELVRDLRLEDRVELPGSVDNPFPWYRKTGMFVLPSRLEGTPNALIEAMSCGAPCIVSDASPGPLELVDDGRSGIVIATDDDAALARAMIRLAEDDALSRRLGEAARRRVLPFRPREALAEWNKVLGSGMGVEPG